MLRNVVAHWLREQAQEKLAETLQQVDAETRQAALPKCDVAVLFALREEAGGLVDRLSQTVTTRCPSYVEHIGSIDERFLVVAETGVGTERAARAAKDIVSLHKPRWLICSGFAGALKPELRRGHIVMADMLADQHGKSLSTGMGLGKETAEATRGLHTGRLLTVDRLIREPDEKRRLGREHDAIACDMETMAVAEVCRDAKIPILSVRAISDAVDDQVQPSVKGYQSQDSLAAKFGAATGAVFQKPSSAKELWQVKEDALRISDRLGKFLVGIIQQLFSVSP